MERKIVEFFSKWKNDIIRKPLVLYGPKQVGKTYSVLDFGKNEYKNVAYFNCYNNKKIVELFKKEKITEQLIIKLSDLGRETIVKNDTLIVFDNVNDIEIIKGVKLFRGLSDYHIITITSRRENLVEFKGEELLFKSMGEMDFEEYLWAKDEKELSIIIRQSFEKHRSCRFHKLAMEHFNEYLKTGGFPEVVYSSINGIGDNELNAIKNKIIDVYKAEMILNKNLIDIQRSLEVFESIPTQLSKENKKFQYSALGKGRRASEYESAIKYLVSNQILYRSFKLKEVKSPLSSCRERDSFKLYLTDTGILYSMLHITDDDLKDNNIKEGLYENYVAKTLVELGYVLYYYQSEGKALVNFVIQNRVGDIIPIELIVKENSKAKNLSVFVKRITIKEGYRITENNFSTKKNIRYIPVYAIYCMGN